MNTTTRPAGADYFGATLAQLEAAGAKGLPADSKVIYSDGPFERPRPAGWRVIETPRAEGTRPVLKRACELARAAGRDLVFFEDDLQVAAGAVEQICAFEVPEELAFVSFFDSVTPPGAAAGLHVYDLRDPAPYWGLQAVRIPARSLPHLWPARGPQLVMPRARQAGPQCSRDYAMKFFLRFSPTPRYGVLFPHLVQHIGDVSAVNSRRAQEFAAEGRQRISHNYAEATS